MKIPISAKSVWRGISSVIAAICILLAILIGYTVIAKAAGEPLPMIFGWGNAVVMSGSMEPELPIGSLVIIKNQNDYSIGDVVTYEEENSTLVTHRLLSLNNDVAVTKGDANNTNDSPIKTEQIRGKVQAVLPRAGNVLLWLKSPVGVVLLLLLGGILIFFPNCLKRKVAEMH